MNSKDEKLKLEREAFIEAFKGIDNFPLGNTIPQIKLRDEHLIGDLFDVIQYSIDDIGFSNYFGTLNGEGYTLLWEAVSILFMLDCEESIKQLSVHMKKEILIPLAIKHGAVNSFKAIANFISPCLDATNYLVQVCMAFDAIINEDRTKVNPYLSCSEKDLLNLIKKFQDIVYFLNKKGANSIYTSETIRGMTIGEYAEFICSKEVEPTILKLMAMIDENASLLNKGEVPFQCMKVQTEPESDNLTKSYEMINDFGIFAVKPRRSLNSSMNSDSYATEESSKDEISEEELLLIVREDEQDEELAGEEIFNFSLQG